MRLDKSSTSSPTTPASQEGRTSQAATPVSPNQSGASPVHVPRLSLGTDSGGKQRFCILGDFIIIL